MTDRTAAAFAYGFYFGVQSMKADDFSEVCPDDECGYDPDEDSCSNDGCPVGE